MLRDVKHDSCREGHVSQESIERKEHMGLCRLNSVLTIKRIEKFPQENTKVNEAERH